MSWPASTAMKSEIKVFFDHDRNVTFSALTIITFCDIQNKGRSTGAHATQ